MVKSLLVLTAALCIGGSLWLLQSLRRLSQVDENQPATSLPQQVPSPDQRLQLEALLESRLKQMNADADVRWPDAAKMAQMNILKRFNAGDYGATLEIARKSLDDKAMPESFRKWVRDQMASILVSLGWLEIKQERCEQALSRFEEADRYQLLPESLKGSGFCRYQLKDAASAASLMRQYLETSAADQTVRILYADALESLGRFREAADALEGVKVNADLPIAAGDLDKRIKSMKAKISEGDEQSVIQFNHFSITYRQDLHEDLIPTVTETLDSAVEDYSTSFGFIQPRTTIEVVLYPAENFSQVVSYGPEWAQGIFDGRMRIPIGESINSPSRSEGLKRVLRHELTHALLSEMISRRSLPNWFNEGLAQRLECISACGNFQFPARRAAMLPRSTLESSFNQLEAPVARLAYLQSLYLVLVLEQAMGADASLRRVVAGLGSQVYLTSDQILGPLGFDFARLYQHAQKLWDSERTISLSGSAN